MAEVMKWKGFAELEQNLEALGEQLRERGVKLMTSRAAVPMRDDAKTRVPVLREPDPRRIAGTLRDAIKIWRKRQTPYAVTYYVGVRGISRGAVRKFKQNVDRRGRRLKSTDNPKDPYYWWWVERGTSKMAARPYLRPAFEAKKTESVKIALKEGQDFIRRTAARFKRVK